MAGLVRELDKAEAANEKLSALVNLLRSPAPVPEPATRQLLRLRIEAGP